MSLQEFKDYVTNSGVNFDELDNAGKFAAREQFDRGRAAARTDPAPEIARLQKENVRLKFLFKQYDSTEEFLKEVQLLQFQVPAHQESTLTGYLNTKPGFKSEEHAKKTSQSGSSIGNALDMTLARNFKVNWFANTKLEFEVEDFSIKDTLLTELLVKSIHFLDQSKLDEYVQKWVCIVQQIRAAMDFYITDMNYNSPEIEVKHTQPLVRWLLAAMADDLKLGNSKIRFDGRSLTVEKAVSSKDAQTITDNKQTKKQRKRKPKRKLDAFDEALEENMANMENKPSAESDSGAMAATETVTIVGVLDVTRLKDDGDTVMFNYEVKRSHDKLTGEYGMEPREQLMGQNYCSSILYPSSLVRGLCTDMFVLSNCWYKSKGPDVGGVHYMEERVMDPIHFVLRLLLSLIDFTDDELFGIATFESRGRNRSNSATPDDDEEGKYDKYVDDKSEPDSEDEGDKCSAPCGGGESGGMAHVVMWCGGRDENGFEEEEDRRRLQLMENKLSGEKPLTESSLRDLGTRDALTDISNK